MGDGYGRESALDSTLTHIDAKKGRRRRDERLKWWDGGWGNTHTHTESSTRLFRSLKVSKRLLLLLLLLCKSEDGRRNGRCVAWVSVYRRRESDQKE